MHHERQAEKEDIDLTPMLDVVFIMLIFFLVTASFAREAGIEVDQPNAAEKPDKEPISILVAISKENGIRIDNRPVDHRALRANIERLSIENPGSGIVIQADSSSHTRTLVQVMDAARQAGVYDISIAADPR